MVKIFDTQDKRLSPNCQLMKECGINAETIIRQSFCVVVLHKLHAQEYVHGNIRKENTTFSDGTSYLIDFDIASKERSHYLWGVQFYEGIRHSGARENMFMLKEHDSYSLRVVIQEVPGPCRTDEALPIMAQLEDETTSLEVIADKLEQLDV